MDCAEIFDSLVKIVRETPYVQNYNKMPPEKKADVVVRVTMATIGAGLCCRILTDTLTGLAVTSR